MAKRKNIYLGLIFLMIFSLFGAFNFDTVRGDPIEWHDGSFNYRIPITVNTDDYIIELDYYEKFQILLDFSELEDFWDFRGSTTGEQIRVYGLEHGYYGNWIELDYYVNTFDIINEEFLFYVKLPKAYDIAPSEILVYIGGDEVTTYSTKDTWDNTSFMWDFETIEGDWETYYTLVDSSPNDLNATSMSMWHWDSIGVVGDGRLFSEAYFNAIDSITITDWTLNFWVKFDNLTFTNNDYFKLFDDSATSQTIEIYIGDVFQTSNSIMQILLKEGTNDIQQNINFNTSHVDLDTWYLMTFVKDDDTINVYINNDLFTTKTQDSLGEVTITPRIAYLGVNSKWFEGELDEVIFYPRAYGSDWVDLKYSNFDDPEALFTFGEIEEIPLSLDVPNFLYPEHETTLNQFYVTLGWDSVAEATHYQIRYTNDYPNFVVPAMTNSTTYSVALLSDVWLFDIRAYDNISETYSNWYSEENDFLEVTMNNTPTISAPTQNQTFYTSEYSMAWSSIADRTRYRVQVATDTDFNNKVLDNYTVLANLNDMRGSGTYYLRVRAEREGEIEGDWSATRTFNIDVGADKPHWVEPDTFEVERDEFLRFEWTRVDGDSGKYYFLYVWNNPNYKNIASWDTKTLAELGDDPYIVTLRITQNDYFYLDFGETGYPLGEYYLRVRLEESESPEIYGEWSDELHIKVVSEIYTAPTVPVIQVPTHLELLDSITPTIYWTGLGLDYNVTLEIYSDSGLNNLVYTNTVHNVNNHELTSSLNYDGTYYLRARSFRLSDSEYSDWSTTRTFYTPVSVSSDIYNWEWNRLNLYGGQTLNYEVYGDPDTQYQFNINEIDHNGNYVRTIATKTTTTSGIGIGSFNHTFSSNANYPFEVREVASNSLLERHYIMPTPTRLYSNQEHRDTVGSLVTSVGVGPVVYNQLNQYGYLHDFYNYEQSSYYYDETNGYIIMHYSIPDPLTVNTNIAFRNLTTNNVVLLLDGLDLVNYTGSNRSFIIINYKGEGALPFITHDLMEFTEADNWLYQDFGLGAFEYFLYGSPDIYTHGESVVLLTNASDGKEWTIIYNPTELEVGEYIEATFNLATEQIWESYNLYAYFDMTTKQYYIGAFQQFTEHLASYEYQFTLGYNVNYLPDPFLVGDPSDYGHGYWLISHSEDYVGGIKYTYFVVEDYTITNMQEHLDDIGVTPITPIPDPTLPSGPLWDWLDGILEMIGFSSVAGRLFIAMLTIAIITIIIGLYGVSVGGLVITAMSLFVGFIAIGFIPLWTIIVFGLVLFLLAIRQFYGSGAGGGGGVS